MSLFYPDEYIESILEIDLDDLQQRGFEGLILDRDNTLVPWGELEVPPAIEQWIRKAKRKFKLCILSNALNDKKVAPIAKILEIPYVICGFAMKPLPIGFIKAMQKIETTPDRTVVVGDQLFRDIIGGNWAGAYTILVKPLSEKELKGTKILRPLERLILKRINLGGEGNGNKENRHCF